MTTQTAFCHPLSDVSDTFSPAREPFALIPLSIVRALSGTCTRSAVLIYCALAAHADRDGRCWPGRARLGDIAGLSERQVSRATAELERKGLLRKESLPGGRVDYYLTPLPPPTPRAIPPDTAVTPPLTPLSPLTDQGTEKTTERAREPDPEPAEQAPSLSVASGEEEAEAEGRHDNSPVSACRLTGRTPMPEQIPEEWEEWAMAQRPELAGTLGEIAENFADYHRSKGTRSACWVAEWRRWIRRERAPRRLQEALRGAQAPQPTDRRYPTPEQEKAPLPKAVQAAIEASNRRFREQCRQMGIDPDTGSRVVQDDRRGEDGRPICEPGPDRA